MILTVLSGMGDRIGVSWLGPGELSAPERGGQLACYNPAADDIEKQLMAKSKKRKPWHRSLGVGPVAARQVLLSGMPRTLGVRMVSITKKRVVAEMRVKRLHINRSGRVNGGALMAFADVMGAAGTVANLPPGYRTGTLESKTNFFRAGEGPVLRAVSIPLHIGRTTMVWQTTIRNPDRNVAAIVTQTQIVIPRSAE
jgi:1,4-dihydroxy-2-naphthoyl-CoA hydrolase